MRSLHAVTLVVPDYDDAVRFFVDILKFVLLDDIDLGDGKRWVRVAPKADGASLLLAKADNGDQTEAIGHQTGGRVGFFLQTDDFSRDHAEMLARGVVFEEDPRHETYGTVAVFRDLFGNRWDLVEFVS